MPRINKPNTKDQTVDVAADNPEGTMDRFTAGLRRVLTAKHIPMRREKLKPRRPSSS
jgi:hypothetical protein